MKKASKLLSLLLALVMVLNLIPVAAHAVEARQRGEQGQLSVTGEKNSLTVPEIGIVEEDEDHFSMPLRVNPLYKDVIKLEDAARRPGMPAPKADYTTQSALSMEAAAQVVRDGMIARENYIPVSFVSATRDYTTVYNEMFNLIMAHTGKPKEGDTLQWQWALTGLDNSSRRSNGDGTYTFDFTYYFEYYTTAEQEAELDIAVDELLESLSLNGKSDYKKIYAVYEYMTKNIRYDYDNLGNPEYTLMYTAYAALVNKTAVCQGYALLFYRLMLELGIDCRLISGWGGGPHGWNIVELDGLYYNVDATWDEGLPSYYWRYFLNSFWEFLDHERDMVYDTIAFHNEYPMAAAKYQQGVEAEMDPYIFAAYANEEGTIIWYLGRNGVIYFDGYGKIHDFGTGDYAPYYSYWEDEITGTEIGEGITGVGDYSFYYFQDMEYAVLPSTLEEIGESAFYYCWKLKEIDLPEGLHTLGNFAFWGCESMEEVVLPGTVTNFGTQIFRDCFNLKTITLSEGITEVPAQFVNSCSNLTSVNLPLTLRTIGDSAFSAAWSLREITIPANVESIGERVFEGDPMEKITFMGNAPQFSANSLGGITATAYYPGNNPTWTEDKLQNYGGNITWVANGQAGCTDHSYETVVTEPGCTTQGYTTYTCANCGDSYVDDYTDALGHSYGSWYVTKEAECETEGQERRDCENCDHYETRVLAAIGHKYTTKVTAPTCTEEGYTTYTCANCGHSYVSDYVEAIGHEYEDSSCIHCGEDEYTVEWKSANATLTGSIFLNFSVVLSDNIVNDPTAFVRFTCADKIVEIPVSEATTSVVNGVTRYRFPCQVYAKQMTDTVTAQMMTANGPVGEPKSYSVAQYCNALMKQTTNPELIATCKAMLNYGAAAQTNFNYRMDDLANAGLSEEDKLIATPDYSVFKHAIVGSEDGIKAASAKLVLDEDVAIRVTFQLTGNKTIDQYTFTIDGVVVQPVESGGRYYIELDGIAASKLNEFHAFSVGGLTVKYSALSYGYMIYNNSGFSAQLKALMDAMYEYHTATAEYVN